MKKILLILLVLPISVFAHPGRTDSNGCHYCRTNCDKWGVPWNEKHCHGSSSSSSYNYSSSASSSTSTKKDCPSNSYYSYTSKACLCNTGYEVSSDKTYCVKSSPRLSNEAFDVLLKALKGEDLSFSEKLQKYEIKRWLDQVME